MALSRSKGGSGGRSSGACMRMFLSGEGRRPVCAAPVAGGIPAAGNAVLRLAEEWAGRGLARRSRLRQTAGLGRSADLAESTP